MREVTYTDHEGRMWWRLLPDGAPDSDARIGIPLGPPPIDSLGLPVQVGTRLHNELYHQRIFDHVDAVRRQTDIATALRSALRLDVASVIALYADRDILPAGEDVPK